ncbi:hypothetical protein LCGC14_0345900 [marine sediment metagenome]|uniref:Uncharacterized protein n=1 Tax=marine sediment metagenome TaxID=412755 RepID=A0A0F9WK31_9ZZZZ
MNRRVFLKLLGLSPIVPSVLMAKESNYAPWPPSGLKKRREAPWSFYINDKEVDASRATDKFGGLRMPFDGAKDGDVCKFVSKGTIYGT